MLLKGVKFVSTDEEIVSMGGLKKHEMAMYFPEELVEKMFLH